MLCQCKAFLSRCVTYHDCANVLNKLLLFRNSKEQSVFPELYYNDQIETYFHATYTPFNSNKTLFFFLISRANNCLQSSREHDSSPYQPQPQPKIRRIYQCYLEKLHTPWKLSYLLWQVKSIAPTLWQKSHFLYVFSHVRYHIGTSSSGHSTLPRN